MITINDVAVQSGFSTSTVSKVLNGKELNRIPVATREKIIKVASELGYKPSMVAKSLVNGKTFTIGVLVPVLGDSTFGNIVHNAEIICKEYGYNIIVSCSHYSVEQEENAIQMLLDRRVDGAIITPISAVDQIFDDSNLQRLEKNNIPVVIIEQPVNNTDIPIVVPDNQKAGYDITNYMISKNIKNISFFKLNAGYDFVIAERVEGFLKALKDNNIEIHKNSILNIDYINDDFDMFDIPDLFDIPNRFDIYDKVKRNSIEGIIAHCDMVAIRLIRSLHKKNIMVPRDILLGSFDDILVTNYMVPTLTTIRHPAIDMVKKSIAILMSRIEDKNSYKNQIIKCEAELIIRESTERI